jgi:protein-disulfide isomerase
MNRRTLLATAAGLATVAGCLSGSGDAGSASAGAGDTTETRAGTTVERTAAEDSLGGHPAARGIEARPTLGPAPFEVDAVIVTFEDPSCTTCRRFEAETFPRIRTELVDPGTASFVYRHFPNVYEWGVPAIRALEATYVRDEDAFWALKGWYYREQGSFRTDNVLARTREFLAAETDVDADAVVSDARTRAHDEAVQADVRAADDASVWATPMSFLFRDGQFVTTATGVKSIAVYREALGL